MTAEGGSQRNSFSLGDVLSNNPPGPSLDQGHAQINGDPFPTDNEGEKRDSLQGTIDFYGLNSGQPPTNSMPYRNSQHSHHRTLSSASRLSGLSRPQSPESKSRPKSSTNSRSSIPIPLHRSFLTPKKPPAAIRLEEQQRQQVNESPYEPIDDPQTASTNDERISEESYHPERIQRRRSAEAVDDIAGRDVVENGEGDVSVEKGFPDYLNGKPAGLRESLQEPLGVQDNRSQTMTYPGVSSDELFRPLSMDDVEKASPLANKLSSPRGLGRPSFSMNRRRSSSGSKKIRDQTNGGRKRNYQTFENPLSTFFCGGRLMTGGDNPVSVIVVLVILLGITGVWFGTTGIWYWVHASDYGLANGAGIAIDIVFVYLFGLTLSSLFAASLREPGVIPRDLDPEPPMAYGEHNSWSEPMDREFVVRQGRVTVRYCETCRSYRPPRSSHCRLCGHCVDGIDHHCSYLHNCVGKRTYLSFITLLVSATISAIYEVVFSALHFSLLCHVDSISFGEAIRQSPGAAVSFLLGVGILPGLFFLLGYHVRLLIFNLTTVEQIRANASKNLLKASKRPDNPFASDSLIKNIIISTLGRPQFPSWIEANREFKVDMRLPNPALTQEKWVRLGYKKDLR